MGAWGAGIFQDDTACDVRDSYNDFVALKFNDDEILQELIQQFQISGEEDNVDESTFWIALALSQHKMGRLSDSVKEKALEYINSGRALKDWAELAEDDKASIKSREKALQKAKDAILSPQPPRKNPKPSIYLKRKIDVAFDTYPWKRDNLYAYKLSSGEYVILACAYLIRLQVNNHYKKMGEYYKKIDSFESVRPCLLLLDYKDKKLPTKEQAINSKPLIFDCSEKSVEFYKEAAKDALQHAQEMANKSFEEFKNRITSYDKSISNDELTTRYDFMRKTAEFDLKKYSDIDQTALMYRYKLFIIDPRHKTPSERVTNLDIQRRFYHEYHYFAENWEDMEKSVLEWKVEGSDKGTMYFSMHE
jgi:hypothetical protein